MTIKFTELKEEIEQPDTEGFKNWINVQKFSENFLYEFKE